MNVCNQQQPIDKSKESTDGPFKATKLWNQIIYDFSTGIGLKKHRKALKTYENCFLANKAVDWLYSYLTNQNPNKKTISRQQAIQLLDKFLKYDIIEKIAAKNADSIKFKDNKDLYRLKNENIPYPHLETSRDGEEEVCNKEPSMKQQWNKLTKSQPTTLVASASSVASVSIASEGDSNHVWKEVVLHHLNMMQPLFASLLNPKEANYSHVAINSTKLSKNGVVLVDDKSKDIPQWVMSAMKCLANWPNNSGNSLPRYPGFERDVFNLIREYFVNLDSPMVPKSFYPLIISLVRDCDLQTIHRQRSGYLPTKESERDFSFDSYSSTPPSKTENRRNRSNSKLKRDDTVFETVFLAGSPMTRILSPDQLTSFFASINSSDGSLDGRSTSPQSIDTLNGWRKPSEAFNLQHLATLPRNIKKQRLEGSKRFKVEKDHHKSSLCLMNFGCILQSPGEEGEYMMDKSVTSLKNFHSLRIYSPGPVSSTTNVKSTNNSEDRMIGFLNLVLLLIPPENRRHLHLLLRLLSRILRNTELKFLCNHSSTIEYYIIETFTRCIIYSGNEKTYNEVAAQYLVSVMLKNTEEIFTLPSYVKNQVNKILNYHLS